MNDLINTFFGPLNKDSCIYFLLLTVIFFSLLVFFLVIELLYIIKNYKNLNVRMFTSAILIFLNLFVGYFANRILYTMCSKSLIK
jgi:hypothetical protein